MYYYDLFCDWFSHAFPYLVTAGAVAAVVVSILTLWILGKLYGIKDTLERTRDDNTVWRNYLLQQEQIDRATRGNN